MSINPWLAAKFIPFLNPFILFISIFSIFGAHSPQDKLKYLIKELVAVLCTMILILFAGPYILSALGVSLAAVKISGGLILLCGALELMGITSGQSAAEQREVYSFFVPVTMPMIVGPGVITSIVSMSIEEGFIPTLVAITIAWSTLSVILVTAMGLCSEISRNTSKAVTNIGGLLLAFIASQLLINGVKDGLFS